MPWTINYIFVLIGTFDPAGAPLSNSLALRIRAVDNPNTDSINKAGLSAGGLAILLAL